MARNTYFCSVELDASSQLTSNCTVNGNPVAHPIYARTGDNFFWYANSRVESFTIQYFVGNTKNTPCTQPLFAHANVDSRHHDGAQITGKCSKTVSYKIDAVLSDGTTATLDPIIIVGSRLASIDFLVPAAVFVLFAVSALAFYRMGRAKGRRMSTRESASA